MRRIGLTVVLALSFFVARLAAAAQQAGTIPRIGMIVPGLPHHLLPAFAAFRQGLRELGYVEGRNIIVEYRFADGRPERFPALADELVRLDARVIVTMGTPATLAAKEASKKVPIVMANVGEAVDLGIVASLAHPGGNVTIKRLEALKEMLPNVTQAAVLSNPINPLHDRALRGLETAARPLGLTFHPIAARDLAEIESAVSTMARKGIRALVVLDDGVFVHHRVRLASLAIQSRMATINGLEEEVEAGGLMAYGPSLTDLAHRASAFVDKILKGTKPADKGASRRARGVAVPLTNLYRRTLVTLAARTRLPAVYPLREYAEVGGLIAYGASIPDLYRRDLPIQQPTKFELVVNAKTAKALGLTIPRSILVRADEIIR